MRWVVFMLCICTVVGNEHRNHGGRRRNMLDENRTPRRQLSENARNLFEAIDGLGESTCDLRGNWYNQHGSELILNQSADGTLTGEFRTAVKLNRAGQSQEYSERNVEPVRGEIFGKIFTFHVHWREKHAMTTWSGQCQRGCDFGWLRSDRDILHASWMIISSTDQCEDYWSATRIGEDIFTRLPRKSGPRRVDEVQTVDTA